MQPSPDQDNIPEPRPGEVLDRVLKEIGVGTPLWKERLTEEMERLGYGLGWDGDRVTHMTVWGDPP